MSGALQRTLALSNHALSALRRRAARSIALGLALALTTAASSAVFLLGESVRATGDRLLEDAPLLTVQRLVAGRPHLVSHADAEAVRAIDSVRGVTERVWGYLYQPALEGNVVVIGIEPDAAEALMEALEVPGEVTTEVRGGALVDDEILVGAVLAASLGLRDGDRLALLPGASETAPDALVLTLRAVLPEGASSSHGDAVLANPTTARRLLGLRDEEATDLTVEVFPPEEIGVVAEHIVEAIPSARLIEREALRRRRALTFEARSGLEAAVLLPLLLAFLVLAWDRLSGIGEDERREIGILKAVGWSTGDVLTARLIESAIIAFFGASLGLLAGYVHVFVLGAPGLASAYFGWSNLAPSLALAPTLDAEVLLFLLALIVLPFVAVSIVPAWRASIVDPDAAMRGIR